MGPSRQQCDKGLKRQWHVLNAAHQASQRQNLSAARQQAMHAPQETSGDHKLHKHISHTITGPGRVAMRTEYFVGPMTTPNVPAVAPGSPLNDNGHNEFNVVDAAYIDYLAETDKGPKKHKRTAGHWNNGYFAHTTLKVLGLRVQLGHPSGECCYNSSTAFYDDFVVLNINGVHEIALDFCACEIAQSPIVQLLHTWWYPSTTVDPRSATTFRLLHHFHILSFESKASTFEYWQTLARLTDNAGDRYEALLRMIKQWRSITLLKRSGYGHDPAGVCAATPGACTVLCPACPQPGKNMLDDWEKALPEVHWKYALFLAIDANFRLARKNVSSDEVDPGLSWGLSYFVEEHEFKSFLNEAGRLPQEKSMYARHSAVNLADTKNARGLAATGVGTVDCARHNLKRPCAVGDLQKGERYINMDYLLFSTLQQTRDIMVLNISYDITCQWSKNLWDRMSRYPSAIHLDLSNKTIVFLIPKFHLPAHIAACQITFSYNLIEGIC
ncbi:uncharacterized protein F5891DRAFT_1186576 [Suillus fuscotomentosus]|uniref:CxC2-like cysteine cluster KDZ transposase-associated domain-containing protein n=1 Tax=Suillus fuscotomentosus TaxID=1912939 RepID=A0AAD4EAN2_9AGAM|nr:uncharacterized protein F5891DRAFT_1186576 [Suillus fuscotomentosus]KAG1902462.1 hypothetical protein F5891DRAFT_1186576 [Suillus fuscotomentosus]